MECCFGKRPPDFWIFNKGSEAKPKQNLPRSPWTVLLARTPDLESSTRTIKNIRDTEEEREREGGGEREREGERER